MNFVSNQLRSGKNNKYLKRRIAVAIAGIVVIAGVGFGIKSIVSNKANKEALASAKKEEAKKEEEKPKPTDIMPNGNIIYAADSYAVSADEVEKMLEGKASNNDKEIFLTFDDGPSENTREILKILKEEDVHATFFDIGSALKDNKENQELLKQEIDQGNAVAGHSFSHNYKTLYPGNSVDVNKFMNELNETNEIMKSVLGKNFNARVIRMPGGYMSRRYYRDPNLKALDEAFAKDNIVSIDWDAETGDATGRHYTVEQYVQNSAKNINTLNHVILLMHDAAAKKETVQALPAIIKFYKEHGYAFKVIKNSPVGEKNSSDSTKGSQNTDNKTK
ncbi:polysaccharide deacetylase [Clostridium perfringens]|uniref:Polysaccharide deacetylase family protein n=1 Tax=Clostridium perfringens (strain SM101 / Type A) TaxID=289380 RepID=Q0SSR8_CLOPS|nr:polysaccharide deacetylase family protein [Clostridium perfringens]ABG85661.1 polysaccharide deacetylase family protein [Clostridium perfringens SM101]MDK0769116.1 polysaccharide deacetylase [Clostridium perfringens]MDK0771815.1 polysaccharide deacetylase [Clostridium perfringens]MDK0776964.1 polysaccharide deacetylase [Clostridium perfringens]MDK0890208.1 polysaccharide deacetylase [Clostridium perfringens]